MLLEASTSEENNYHWDGYDSDRDPNYLPSNTSSDDDDDDVEDSNKIRSDIQHDTTRLASDNQDISEVMNVIPTEEVNGNITYTEEVNNGNVNPAEEVNGEVPNEPLFKPYARKLRRERTVKRHTGQEYVTAKGRLQRKRALRELGNCRMKCKMWLNENLRETIFTEYWQQGSYERRINYIGKLVTSSEVCTRRIRNANTPKERNITYNYAFEIDGERRKVCKRCFQSTIDETDKFIRNALMKKSETKTGTIKEDQRGRHEPANKSKPDKLKEIADHIESFPKYESHYTRRVNDKKYLSSDLNLSKMYQLYREVTPKPLGRKIYELEFHKQKLAFKVPKTDTCHKCEVMKMQLDVITDEEELRNIKAAQEIHHREADLAYLSKKNDKTLSRSDPTLMCFTFDLQQCLPTPFLETSVSFYKRKYWTYNLTVHNCGTGSASCYLWHEAVAMRGANEIASCLFKEIMSLPPEVKKITLYSDTCGGQNKNFHVAAMFMAVLQLSHIEEINHKFMVSGHSHMECDIDHSLIEKQKKRSGMKISHPQDWATLIRCTNKKQPFRVVEMTQDDFYDFANLLTTVFVKKQKNSKGGTFKLQECKWLKYTKEYGMVYYKKSLDETEMFEEINFNRRGRRTTDLKLIKRYNGPLPIAPEKKVHLLDMLSLIPDVYKSFYRELKTKDMADNDPDLEDYEFDDE